MDYVLVSDDCSDCSYVSNAFSLLKFSFKKLFLNTINTESVTNALSSAPEFSTVFVCKNITDKCDKSELDKSTNKNIITCSTKQHDGKCITPSIPFLKIPFSTFEFQNTLAECANQQHHQFKCDHPIFKKLVGHSQKIMTVKSMIARVAASDTTVLILGPSGAGKDIVASCIHQLSERKENAFVPINCGAIPGELMESELFGHEKGAFTGALTRRIGRFEIANDGSLFLDEIGDMPLTMQVKLLRVIQERKIERIGGNNITDVNVRLLAATHKNLETMISEHQFREDLYYRLNVFPIYVPSLADRKEDIPFIMDYQLDKIHERLKHRVSFTQTAIELLCDYAWPGNIRELQNFLERMVILYPDQVINEKKIEIHTKK